MEIIVIYALMIMFGWLLMGLYLEEKMGWFWIAVVTYAGIVATLVVT